MSMSQPKAHSECSDWDTGCAIFESTFLAEK